LLEPPHPANILTEILASLLKEQEIAISIDGKEHYLDKIMNERVWKTLKHDYVCLHLFDKVLDLKKGLR